MKHRMVHIAEFVTCFLLASGLGLAQTTAEKRAEDDRLLEHARAVFPQLVGSENRARTLVAKLDTYHYDSPWQLSTTIPLAQRLLVKEWKPEDIPPLFTACGDAAAALDGDDEKFVQIVAVLAAIKIGATSEVESSLGELEELGIPAFKLLAEATGKTPADVRRFARAGRINSPVTTEILLDQFTRRYEGLAKKLAKQRKER
jgi:hypothetical protein